MITDLCGATAMAKAARRATTRVVSAKCISVADLSTACGECVLKCWVAVSVLEIDSLWACGGVIGGVV
jgi:hypothetical protein